MTHLVAHVERALSSQQQQQQKSQPTAAAAASTSRTRRASAAATATASRAGADSAAADNDAASELRQQVAAGVAAHVSARVPLASSLIPHVVYLLGDQVNKQSIIFLCS
jgi:hypothetical protein